MTQDSETPELDPADKNIKDMVESISLISTDYAFLEGNCLYAHFQGIPNDIMPVATSQKLNGAAFFIITRGTTILQQNTETYNLTAPAVISFPPGSTISFDNENWADADVYMVSLSTSLLQEINISFSAISSDVLINRTSPAVSLSSDEASMIVRGFSLIANVIKQGYGTTITRHIICSLITAIIYQITAICYKQLGNDVIKGSRGHSNNYVKDFLRLVHLYYMKERTLLFYAQRLYISPKYLSMLVKEATGRSASEWIDHFVIMEAKNQLRFSGKTIQQVAYSLNFLNQSSFGKYFKHLTGMSPTAYQKKG